MDGPKEKKDQIKNHIETAQEAIAQTTSRCTSSNECGSGFSCIDGRCTQDTEGGSGGSANAGDCGADGKDCGTPRGCSLPSCSMDGSMDEKLDCCADDVIYEENHKTGKVEARCPANQVCNQYCTDYYQANAATRFGCSLMDEYGRAGGNICGSCESCGFLFDTSENVSCIPKLQLKEDAPCWCDKGARCDICEPCQYQDSDAGDYGLCLAYEDRNDAPDDCKECVEMTDPECPCGISLSGTYKACKVYGNNVYSDPVRGLQTFIQRECEKACPKCTIEQPTEFCTVTRVQAPAAEYPTPTEVQTCPPASQCQYIGVIYAAGQPEFTALWEVCPNAALPTYKGPDPECSCSQQCGECQFCDDGSCVPSPACGQYPDDTKPPAFDPDTGEGVLGV